MYEDDFKKALLWIKGCAAVCIVAALVVIGNSRPNAAQAAPGAAKKQTDGAGAKRTVRPSQAAPPVVSKTETDISVTADADVSSETLADADSEAAAPDAAAPAPGIYTGPPPVYRYYGAPGYRNQYRGPVDPRHRGPRRFFGGVGRGARRAFGFAARRFR